MQRKTINLFLLFLYLIIIINSKTISTQLIKKPTHTKYYTSAIIATNDIHGSVFPNLLKRLDTGEKYTQGGLKILGQLIENVRDQLGQQNVLFLDAGDEFQGGIQSSSLVSNGTIISDFFNQMNLSASTIGNHQFDLGPEFLQKFMTNRKAPFLAANLASQNKIFNFLPNSKTSELFHIQHGIKIGVIGLVTKLTPQTTKGFIQGLFPKYQFRDYPQILIQQSKKLRDLGANAVVLLAHIGTRCPGPISKFQIITNQTVQSLCTKDQITDLLDQIPPGTLDGVIQGHRHESVHHYYRGVPIVGSKNGGISFNILYFTFDLQTKKLLNTSIQGSIPVCQKIFQNTRSCEYIPQNLIDTVGPLINWQFHGKPVIPHQKLSQIFKKWQNLMIPYLKQVVHNTLYLQRIKRNQSDLGKLFADILFHSASQKLNQTIDFSIINVGTFRTVWSPAILQQKDIYNMVPFDNTVVSLSITGQKLIKLITEIHKGGWTYGMHGLVVKLIRSPYEVVQVRLPNGKQIDPSKEYIGCLPDFLLKGGDGFKNVVGLLYEPRDSQYIGYLREIVRQQLMKMGKIDKQKIGYQQRLIYYQNWLIQAKPRSGGF